MDLLLGLSLHGMPSFSSVHSISLQLECQCSEMLHSMPLTEIHYSFGCDVVAPLTMSHVLGLVAAMCFVSCVSWSVITDQVKKSNILLFFYAEHSAFHILGIPV